MDINAIIDSYVRDVAACLPRAKRNDVAYELRALLDEELAGRAQVAGHAPDKAMAVSYTHLDVYKRQGSDNLFLQYDIYHMQVMEGDLARTIEANLARIAHVQLADNPGRHEPGTGEINYPFLYEHLDRIGYAGWVGAEYKPKAGTVEGLGWFAGFADKGSAAA